AEDGIRDATVTGVQTCALPICIERARRGCEELTLMVGNIMDASRVQADVESVTLSQVPLAASVTHILEILESITLREERVVPVRSEERRVGKECRAGGGGESCR